SPALLHLEITLLFQRSASPRGDTRWCPSGAAKVDWSPLVLVPAGAMILPLELHEFVNRPDCFLILGRYAILSASGEVRVRIGDKALLFGHDLRAGYLMIMNEARKPEIPRLELDSDLPQMLPDGLHCLRVARLLLQLDSPAVGQGVEEVSGGVLIHSHCYLATRLQLGKRFFGVRLRHSVIVGLASREQGDAQK